MAYPNWTGQEVILKRTEYYGRQIEKPLLDAIECDWSLTLQSKEVEDQRAVRPSSTLLTEVTADIEDVMTFVKHGRVRSTIDMSL
jgi:hypothetical protein